MINYFIEKFGVISAVGGSIDNIAKGAVGSIDNIAKGGLGSLDNIAKGGLGSLDNIGKGGLGSLDNIGKGLGGNLDNIGKGLGGSADNIGKGLGGSVDNIGKGLGGNVDNIGKGLGGNADNIGKGLGGSADNLAGGTDNLVKNLDDVGQVSDDAVKKVDNAIKNSPDDLVTKSKGILAQAGDAAFDFAKKHPLLAAAGLTASGVAIYAAANNISFAQATGQLTNSIGTNVIKPIAESVGTLAGAAVSVGVNDVAGPLLAPIWKAFGEIFSNFKKPLIIIGVILVLIILYKIYNFINN